MPIFNIRVYALLINEKNEVLITDEFRFGKEMTKFPGGGLGAKEPLTASKENAGKNLAVKSKC